VRIRLAGDLHAPAAARRFVRSALDGGVPGDGPPRPDDVVLVVSELVTNSVRAGAVDIDVELVVLDASVELGVSDDAPGWPNVHHAGLDDVDGRGLEIVGKLADSWHTSRLAPGKRVTVTWSRVGFLGPD
jgi:anti-sigma regulatory factor (Ser/Thr protein kinase)